MIRLRQLHAVLLLVMAAAWVPLRAEWTLADQGRATMRIVVADDAIPSERTAASELADYLYRVSGGSFERIEESRSEGPAIYVGWTHFARVNGLGPEGLGSEDWIVRSVGRNLILCGGRPRGTLYAVYHFLEQDLGVRWWTPYEEFVPRRATLVLPSLDRRGRPAFLDRDLHGLSGPPEFRARNRLNGHFAFVPWSHGGTQAYGPPSHNHDFFSYVPPEEYFDDHPDYYSELDGERKAKQLCLTNAALRGVVESRLRGFLEQSRLEASQREEPPPRLFSFSQNDWAGACRCGPCRGLAEREGGDAAPLVSFLNRLADAIAEDYPEVRLSTLAYQQTFDPPRRMKLRDSVVVRLSALFERDFARPVEDRSHRDYRRAIEGWKRVTRHLRIWDYAVTFGGSPNNFPLPNLQVLSRDLRYYHAQGIEGILLQVDHPVLSDLRDLKVWVLAKLVEDPSRDLQGLIDEFTEGFYGSAGAIVREYLHDLERSAARKPAKIVYPMESRQFVYLDREFLARAQSAFDRAEARVGADPVLHSRVRRARTSLDRATLWRWREVFGTDAVWAPSEGGPALSVRKIAERFRTTANEEIARCWPEGLQAGHRQSLAEEIVEALSELRN